MLELTALLTSIDAWRTPTMIGILVGTAAPLFGAASQLNKRTFDALDKLVIPAGVLGRGVASELTDRVDAHERHANLMFIVTAVLGASSFLSGLGVGLGKLTTVSQGNRVLAVAIALPIIGVISLVYAEAFRRRTKRSLRALEQSIRELTAAATQQREIGEALRELLQSVPHNLPAGK